ncbi:hypothetical protein P7H21_25230 [Paenibacillus larvae]|nr:hypothetical protein [Paenibacillus larvae]
MKANFEAKDNINSVDDPKQRAIKAKAELIRSVMREQSVSIDVRQALGDNVIRLAVTSSCLKRYQRTFW